MEFLTKHITRCFIAGIVALLPIGGLVLGVVYAETQIASGFANQSFYFPGMGLLGAMILIYLIGLIVSTFVGRWAWNRIDGLLNKLPALGKLYQTLKQILGYGEGEEAMFQRVVLVPSRHPDAVELGLVTSQIQQDGQPRLVVFVPGAPT